MYKYSDLIMFGGLKERPDETSRTIINVSTTTVDSEDIHIPLNDGAYDGGNSQQQFAKAVNAVRERIQSETPIFVHCAIGQSRSISVLATAIAAETDQDFTTVQDELMSIRGSFTEPANSLQKKGRVYLRHTR